MQALPHGRIQSLPQVSTSSTPRSVSEFSVSSGDSGPPQRTLPAHVHEALDKYGFTADSSGVVTWQTGHQNHPRHWPFLRKAYDSSIIIILEFFMTLISNTGSSIALEASDQLRVSRQTALFCFTTVYLLGQAFGGLIFPPICESFGGRTIYVSSTFGFAMACLLMAAWPTLPVIVIGRLFSGAMSAMPAVVATGSIENMWAIQARTWLIYLWIAAAVLGLALGPPTATYIATSEYGWPWIFYASTVITFIFALLCLAMQESRPSQLLREKVKVVSRQTSCSDLSIHDRDCPPSTRAFFRDALLMPLRLFFTEPIVFLTSIMAATVYGVSYLFSEALSHIYVVSYGFDHRQASLVFLLIGAGVIFSILPRLYDTHITNKRLKRNQTIEPEDKLFGFYIAAPMLAIGLWWFAWSVPPLVEGVSAWVSIASLSFFGFAVVEFDCVLSGYLTDVYATYAASANAPMAFLRATMSGTFPLFGTQMFKGLGNNSALFILAGLATAYCGIAALFGVFGASVRRRSPFAELTWATAQDDSGGLNERKHTRTNHQDSLDKAEPMAWI
ncbi:uncharacterized protein MYCFIDRAFT_55780 [Pseudocercospora fijiensis CIRAD86]|uniref:Major facilitator superfamily (MFS) profile domain-containing protein n=1 Tax=Pseudocercospora fijiensis (strain CIRAD86) TaxID=383855 RepID=N1Q917_PSEFD|nr:uncharacterized protein MYCFIDRAFT_55780 [Pseudocercospora fijiensis CIRAD86]EME89369.1 hypothetical protein MYCFIDRAFT_55780 [Pseudocercospora fijiensis CIRAD86]